MMRGPVMRESDDTDAEADDSSPVLFALTGAAAAVVWGMFTYPNHTGPFGYINPCTSIPAALIGGFAGLLIGSGASLLTRGTRAERIMPFVAVVLLATLLGAMGGWLAGDIGAKNPGDHEERTKDRGQIGAAAGLVAGILVGGLQLVRKRKRPAGEPDSTTGTSGG
jgi:hypothetical protein